VESQFQKQSPQNLTHDNPTKIRTILDRSVGPKNDNDITPVDML
jgi:hypothetical protein